MKRGYFLVLLIFSMAHAAHARDALRMAVTTSFYNSGLADVLLPEIAEDLDLDVQLLIVGTGQALRLGAAGDVDAVLVHSRAAEEAFVAAGHGTHRREIMYNDFVLVGPAKDPAKIAGASDAKGAMQRIAKAQTRFVSRGDDSGTHQKEQALWRKGGLEPEEFEAWYVAVGAGMGAALNTASGMDAYVLSDRASWANFANKGDLTLLFAGDPVMFNQYAFLPVSAASHPHVKARLVKRLEEWLTGPRAKDLINSYQIDGEQLFIFNSKTSN